MKKSILLTLGSVAIAVGAVAAALPHNQPSEAKAISERDCVYLDFSKDNFHWWGNDLNAENSDEEGKKVLGLQALTWDNKELKVRGHKVHESGNDYLYEFVFDFSSYCTIRFFIAQNSLYGSWTDRSYPFGESGASFQDKPSNRWKVDSQPEAYGQCGLVNEDNIPASERAEYFGKFFNENVGCSSEGVTKPSGWGSVKAEYNALSNTAKTLVVSAKADQTSESDLEKAMATYDWAVAHNPTLKDSADDKFIAGRTAGAGFVTTINGSGNSALAPIAGIAGIGLAVAGTMVFIAKKRKDI